MLCWHGGGIRWDALVVIVVNLSLHHAISFLNFAYVTECTD